MEIKPGASISGLQPEMAVALSVIASVYQKNGKELVVTEGTAGRHSPKSRHYLGFAVDLRTRNILRSKLDDLARQVRRALGKEFWVLLEADHMHVEFRPKGER
jgi:hypothetical protein